MLAIPVFICINFHIRHGLYYRVFIVGLWKKLKSYFGIYPSRVCDEDCLSIKVRRDYIINDALREGIKNLRFTYSTVEKFQQFQLSVQVQTLELLNHNTPETILFYSDEKLL